VGVGPLGARSCAHRVDDAHRCRICTALSLQLRVIRIGYHSRLCTPHNTVRLIVRNTHAESAAVNTILVGARCRLMILQTVDSKRYKSDTCAHRLRGVHSCAHRVARHPHVGATSARGAPSHSTCVDFDYYFQNVRLIRTMSAAGHACARAARSQWRGARHKASRRPGRSHWSYL
jgi:hypothetical protein